MIDRFQTIWEDLCSVHNLYESKCKRRIQRQLEIGTLFQSTEQFESQVNLFDIEICNIAGYNLDDEAIDNVMINGTSVFMKEV